MYNRQVHVFICVLFVTLAINTHPKLCAEYHWHRYFTKETVIASTLGTAVALLIGKKAYEIYLHLYWPNKSIIQHCRTLYKKTYATIQHNKKTYQNNSQLSDWDLKENIYAKKNNSPYPFMAYHSSLTQSLYTINRQMPIIQIAIARLHQRKQQLHAHTTQKHSYMIEILSHLEIQGHLLEAHLYKIQLMIIMLKNRIALFKEYNDDYHNWIYELNKKRQERTQNN